jgi:hypothetical protein
MLPLGNMARHARCHRGHAAFAASRLGEAIDRATSQVLTIDTRPDALADGRQVARLCLGPDDQRRFMRRRRLHSRTPSWPGAENPPPSSAIKFYVGNLDPDLTEASRFQIIAVLTQAACWRSRPACMAAEQQHCDVKAAREAGFEGQLSFFLQLRLCGWRA